MNTRKLLITNSICLLQLLAAGFFFYFFFFPDKLHLRFQSLPPVAVHDPLTVRLAKVVLWLSLVIIFIRLYYFNFVKTKRAEWASGLGLSVLTLFILLVFFEIGFMFFAQTHGVATTKASALWVDKYYKPVNSLGYRDKEPDLNTAKRVILFVGDSFTAGYGNKDVKERFSDKVYSGLDTTLYDVYNLGVPGIDTRGEAEKLAEYTIKPHMIILAYFFNDIEEAAADHGFRVELPVTYSEVPQPFRLLVSRLYLPNFIYWHLPGKSGEVLDHFLRNTYHNPAILKTHLEDLSKIIRYKEENQAELIVAVIPFLTDLGYSAGFTAPVIQYLKENGVRVVTFEEEISKLPVKERVVNKTDSHASAKVNEIIARELLKVIL